MAKICILTLGCKVNQYDSGEIIKSLYSLGKNLRTELEITEKFEIADVYIINTCAVTSFAEKKSRYQISRILRLAPRARIIVCGCAGQLNAAQFDAANVIKVFGCDKREVAKCAIGCL